MSDTENGIGPRRSTMEILSLDRGWVRNEGGPDRRIGHGYDKQAQDQMGVSAYKTCSAAPKYTVGQQVWLSTENLHLAHALHKLSEQWLGPYTIISLTGPNAVELKLPKLMQIHPVVNASQVKPYCN